MEERIVQFIAALRAGGVRVSLAESADALKAVDLLGVQEREAFRMSLRTTLVKEANGIPVFEELFPLFFGQGGVPPMTDVMEDMTEEEAQMIAQAMHMFNEQLRKMMEKLLRGEQLSKEELEQLSQLTGLSNTKDLRYRDWMAERMKRAMRFKDVQKAMREMMEMMQQMGMTKERMEQLRELIKANQQALEEQLRQHAGEQIAENMAQEPPNADVDGLFDRPFHSLDDRDMDKLRKEVQKLANRLRSRISLRQKRAKTGQLDAKSTIRANLKHGGVPVEIKHRNHKLKPKLVVLCDISRSMRTCAELVFSLIYSLQDVITKTHSFAFHDHLEYISPDFVGGRQPIEVIYDVVPRMAQGGYRTDLGYSLDNFSRKYMDLVDSRTTVIVIGDGCNNGNDPRLDILETIARRSRRTIWIVTEMHAWTQYDSDMARYAPICDDVVSAYTLNELSSVIDNLLTNKPMKR